MILIVDIGTSSLRFSLIDNNGKKLYKDQKKYDLIYDNNSSVEMDLRILLEKLDEATIQLGKYNKDHSITIDGISITAQRSSVIAVDKNCNPLSNAIMWQDKRATYVCENLRDEYETIYNIEGLIPIPVYSAPKMKLLKDQFNEIYTKAEYLIGFQEFVLHYFCGVFATDYSIASRTCLFDITKKEWSDRLINLFELDKNKLCPLVEVGSIVGNTTERITKILNLKNSVPVITAGGDQQCAALGSGCFDDGSCLVNSGTGAYVIALTDKPIFDKKYAINCNLSAIPNKWVVESSTLSAGKSLDWVNNNFFYTDNQTWDYENFTRACKNTEVGAGGLIFSPSFLGRTTQNSNNNQGGSLLNIGLHNTKEQLARAIMEGVCAEISFCLNCVIEALGKVQEPIMVSGGITSDELYNQNQSDMFEKKILRRDGIEATTLGAWISACVSLNKYNTYFEAFEQSLKNADTKVYNPNKENFKIYRKIKSEINNI